MSILYHLGNDNVVVDALNLMTMCIVYRVEEGKKDLVKDVHWLAWLHFYRKIPQIVIFWFIKNLSHPWWLSWSLNNTLIHYWWSYWNPYLVSWMSHSPKRDGVVRCKNRLCVPDVDYLRNRVLEEAHGSRYSFNPGSTKMYCELRDVYWWDGLQRDIEEFVSNFPNGQQVKVEQLKPSGLIKKWVYLLGSWKKLIWTFLLCCLQPAGKMTQLRF